MTSRVVTFGEIMLRLSTHKGERLGDDGDFLASWAGSEANVAVSLSASGFEALFVSALPKSAIGERCLRSLKARDIKCREIVRSDGRMGILFLETGAMMRPSRVIYDRTHSVFADIDACAFDWPRILEGADWFHTSAITLALSAEAFAAAGTAIKVARERSIPVSLDLNFRRSLWASEAQAREMIGSLLHSVDYVIGNEEELAIVVDGKVPELCDDVSEQAERMGFVADKLWDEFPGIQGVFSSIRISRSAEENDWSGAWFRRGSHRVAASYRLWNIVDRVGSGDAFAAGVIASLLDDRTFDEALEFATAAGALKHTIRGDFLTAEKSEIMAIISKSGQTGRIER